jgi:hypothetical protein
MASGPFPSAGRLRAERYSTVVPESSSNKRTYYPWAHGNMKTSMTGRIDGPSTTHNSLTVHLSSISPFLLCFKGPLQISKNLWCVAPNVARHTARCEFNLVVRSISRITRPGAFKKLCGVWGENLRHTPPFCFSCRWAVQLCTI